MKPTVLIATHDRVEITCKVIDSLIRQTLVPEVIIVVASKSSEIKIFRDKYPQVYTVQHINSPLGAKWQTGVNHARKIYADPLIICGSDDFLEYRHVERCCAYLMKGYDFVGLKSWYIYDEHSLYHFDYLARIPLGGGRAYSAKFLDMIDWKLFNHTEKHLDDRGYDLVNFNQVRKKILMDPYILSVKGNWPVMNKMDDILRSPNARMVKKNLKLQIMEQNFNYVF